MFGEIIAVV